MKNSLFRRFLLKLSDFYPDEIIFLSKTAPKAKINTKKGKMKRESLVLYINLGVIEWKRR
jgi:hypothetical protein